MLLQHRHCLAKFIKGSLVKANANKLLLENLETSKAAENARASRKPKD
jgi:hypothetical protein